MACEKCSGLAHASHAADCPHRYDDVVRDVWLSGNPWSYRLTLYEDGVKFALGQRSRIRYRLVRCDGPDPDGMPGTVIFEGTDFCPPAGVCDDSDESVRSLIGLLTTPGEDYTQQQLEWTQSGDCEALQEYLFNLRGKAAAIYDWENREHASEVTRIRIELVVEGDGAAAFDAVESYLDGPLQEHVSEFARENSDSQARVISAVHAYVDDPPPAAGSALRPLTRDEVTIELETEQDETPLSEALDSGDPDVDAEHVQNLAARLNAGDVWAWCVVRVSVRWRAFSEDAILGGCSYASEADFRQEGGYFDDLVNEALSALNQRLAEEYSALRELAS